MPSLSDRELIARMPALVSGERTASAEVIAHLMEIDRRRLYLAEACSSLFTYCQERLGYSEDEALRRVRVARLARKVPAVLDELRRGAIHLTGLFVLSNHVTPENADEVLGEARGKSRRELERLLARLFPQPDVAERIVPLGLSAPTGPGAPGIASFGAGDDGVTCVGTGKDAFPGRLEPLSASRYRVEFTASSEFCGKVERARELVSHSLPNGDLAALLERALDELIAREVRRRGGAGARTDADARAAKPRKPRKLLLGSRRVPVEVARAVWERDGARCAFINSEGRRCSERRFLTVEHRLPFAFGGLPTVENLCLFCAPHNLHSAREAFGQPFLERKRAQRNRSQRTARAEPDANNDANDANDVTDANDANDANNDANADATDANNDATDANDAKPERAGTVSERALFALVRLGFRRAEAERALDAAANSEHDVASAVRAALLQLTPRLPCA